ncbi:serine/threonine protein kinase, partial [Coemansia sp. RSA 2599]
MSTSTSTSTSNSNSSVHIGQQLPACDSVEMRERPRVPPKPANLRAASTTPTTMSGAGTSSASPTHTHSLAAEAANALNAPAASDSPAPSLHTANAALNAAAATPRPPHSPAQPRPMAGSKGQAARKRTVDDFSFGRTLGEGSYSTVVEATEKATGRVFAAKILDKRHIIKEKKIKYVNIERDILQALHHPFIVRLHYAFQDSQSLYFIIDLAANGELLSWIRK